MTTNLKFDIKQTVAEIGELNRSLAQLDGVTKNLFTDLGRIMGTFGQQYSQAQNQIATGLTPPEQRSSAITDAYTGPQQSGKVVKIASGAYGNRFAHAPAAVTQLPGVSDQAASDFQKQVYGPQQNRRRGCRQAIESRLKIFLMV